MLYAKKSTDVGAPSLTGAAGGLISVLDYCLVTTAGWTKSFTATNEATYRAPAGNRLYLGVTDTTANNSRLRGFETASAAGVAQVNGTGPFPTDLQLSGGMYFGKSSDTGTARAWWFYGDDRCFWFICSPQGSTSKSVFFWGDFIKTKTSDAYNTMLRAQNAADTTGGYTNNIASYTQASVANATDGYGYIPRAHTQLGGARGISLLTSHSHLSGAQQWPSSGAIALPAPCSGKLVLSPALVSEPTVDVRGVVPALYFSPHQRSLFSDLQEITGTGEYSGKTFTIFQFTSSSGLICLETSDTWYV